ncbi:MAG: hypothetical protein K0S26_24 [Bacteroidota bacterium]|jgi:hypothetical protein|nr:hypothetical protein [Bacteroidota bacterium]
MENKQFPILLQHTISIKLLDMKIKNKSIFTLMLALFAIMIKAQVSVVNIQLMPYNITPDGLIAASIMNNGNTQQVQLISKFYNFNNELLITVKSNPFNLKQGLNSPFDGSRTIAATEYASGQQVNYIKTTRALPSGTFKVCITVIQTSGSEALDEFCDEIESNFNQYLYLVYPADKDTIETSTPMLTWSHSEPFSVLSQGEYYRMLVSEIKNDQSAEAAVTINTPVMGENYLTTHSLQYPYDAKELIPGGHYAWQVQKMANGVVTNKTEAWEFIVRKKPEEKEIKYVALKQRVDASFYTATNGKVYFKFNEEYSSQGSMSVIIKSDDGKEYPVSVSKDENGSSNETPLKVKVIGDNRFILDLNTQNIKPGFYIMHVKNEKKDVYLLKFYLP